MKTKNAPQKANFCKSVPFKKPDARDGQFTAELDCLASSLQITEETLQEKLDITTCSKLIADACYAANKNPQSFYTFISSYTGFNRPAAGCVVQLTGHIDHAVFQKLFENPDDKILPDRSNYIARQIYEASTDEYLGRHHWLAAGLREAARQYAAIPLKETARHVATPWLNAMNREMILNYCGDGEGIRSLAKAVGYHLASELLADIEFSIIDQILLCDKESGFAAFLMHHYRKLNSAHFDMSFMNERLDPVSWIRSHAQADHHAAEYRHFQHALHAANGVIYWGQGFSGDVLQSCIYEGAAAFGNLQTRFFRQFPV